MKRALMIAAVLAVGIIVGWKAHAFLDIDSCLDAGGAWEYRGSYCHGISPVS